MYTPGEVRTLTSDARLLQRRRVAYALEALAGLRFGEASALRWRSWSRAEKPLSRLNIFEAYDSNNRRLKTVKIRQPRAPYRCILGDERTTQRDAFALRCPRGPHANAPPWGLWSSGGAATLVSAGFGFAALAEVNIHNSTPDDAIAASARFRHASDTTGVVISASVAATAAVLGLILYPWSRC